MARGDANFGAAGKKGYMGGKYSRKAMNLTKKQLGKAGVAAARKRTVDISQTRREDGKTLGPGGKPLTGRVRMGNGNIAVYKAGKRVIAQKPKPATSTRAKTGSGSSGSSGPTRTPAPTPKPKPKDKIHTRNARDRAMAGRAGLTATSRGRTGMSGRDRAMAGRAGLTATSSGSASSLSSVSFPGLTTKKSNDWVSQAVSAAAKVSSKPKPQTGGGPKKGDTRPKGGFGGTQIYTGTKWVNAVKKNGKWVAA